MTHPTIQELALYSGGDLSLADRLRVAWHVRGCDGCRGEVESFVHARHSVEESMNAPDAMPANLDWDRLAGEMKANIRLGLAAGEIVSIAPAPSQRKGWRVAVAMTTATAMVMLVMTVTVLRGPKPNLPPRSGVAVGGPSIIFDSQPQRPEVVLKATLGGIGLERNGQTMALAYEGPAAKAASTTVSTQGAIRARLIDDDTGQVTIYHVYSE
ncbi:MAG: hypothetical protein U0Q16_15060 [Bryobacteraceae bacterium]